MTEKDADQWSIRYQADECEKKRFLENFLVSSH